jgi:hypothetical protein
MCCQGVPETFILQDSCACLIEIKFTSDAASDAQSNGRCGNLQPVDRLVAPAMLTRRPRASISGTFPQRGSIVRLIMYILALLTCGKLHRRERCAIRRTGQAPRAFAVCCRMAPINRSDIADIGDLLKGREVKC